MKRNYYVPLPLILAQVQLFCLKCQYHICAPALEANQMVSSNAYQITFNGFMLFKSWEGINVKKKIQRDFLKGMPMDGYHFQPQSILAGQSL
jgi:hypothetical protein